MRFTALCGVSLSCIVMAFPAYADDISTITGGSSSLTVGLTPDSSATDGFRPSSTPDSLWVNHYNSVDVDAGQTVNAYKVILGPKIEGSTTTQPTYPAGSLFIGGTLNVYGSGLNSSQSGIVDNGNQVTPNSSTIYVAPGGRLRVIGGDLTISNTSIQMGNERFSSTNNNTLTSIEGDSGFIDTNGHNVTFLGTIVEGINKIGEGTLYLSKPSSIDSNGTQHFLGSQSISQHGQSVNNLIQGNVVATAQNITNLDYIALSYVGDATFTAPLNPALLKTHGTLIIDQDDNGSIDTAINGTGTLIKRGTGTVTLTGEGDNSYSGNTIIEAGTLAARPSGLADSAVSIASKGTLSLTNVGTVSDGVINDGNVNSITTPPNEDLYETEVPNTISGTGTLAKDDTGSVYLTGDGHQFTGSINVRAGNLGVNSNFGNASTTVQSGAMLSGTGTVGNLTVSGTLAPGRNGANPAIGLAGGQPIGTLNVNGNVTMQKGSTFDVLAQNRQSDQLNATGTVNLSGASLHVTVLDSLPMRSHDSFTLVNAQGGLLSPFANTETFLQSAKNLQGEQPYLVPTLNYTDKQAQIIVKDVRSTDSSAAGSVTKTPTQNTPQDNTQHPTTTQNTPQANTQHPTTTQNTTQDNAQHPTTTQNTTQDNAQHPTTTQNTTQDNAQHPTTTQNTTQDNTQHPTTTQNTTQDNTQHPTTTQNTTQDNTQHPTTTQNTTQDNTQHPTTTQNTTQANTQHPTPTQNTTQANTQHPTTTQNTTQDNTQHPTPTQNTTQANTQHPTTTQNTTQANTQHPTPTQNTTQANTQHPTTTQNTTQDNTQHPTTATSGSKLPENKPDTAYRPNFRLASSTRNQDAAADGLSALVIATHGGGALGDALVNLTRPQAHQALSALSGEAYASTRTAMVNESYYLRNALITRLDCVTNDLICNTQDAGYHQKGNPHALSVWGVTYGSVGGNAGGNGTSSMNQSSVGWIMGADTTLQHWRVGGMLAYGRSMFSDASAHNSSSHANNASIGLYGGRAWSVGGVTHDAALTLKLGMTYSWDMINTNRSIRLPDYQEKTHSNYRAGTAQAFGETGYRFTLQAHHTPLALEPFVRMTYLSTQYGSFHEHGSLAALRVKGRNDNMGYATFGLKSSTRFTLGAVAIAPHLSAAYRYGFGMTHTTAHAAFATAGQDATMMSVVGTPISANTALLNTGLSAKLAQRLDVSVDYIGQYGSHITSSGGFGSATFRF